MHHYQIVSSQGRQIQCRYNDQMQTSHVNTNMMELYSCSSDLANCRSLMDCCGLLSRPLIGHKGHYSPLIGQLPVLRWCWSVVMLPGSWPLLLLKSQPLVTSLRRRSDVTDTKRGRHCVLGCDWLPADNTGLWLAEAGLKVSLCYVMVSSRVCWDTEIHLGRESDGNTESGVTPGAWAGDIIGEQNMTSWGKRQTKRGMSVGKSDH